MFLSRFHESFAKDFTSNRGSSIQYFGDSDEYWLFRAAAAVGIQVAGLSLLVRPRQAEAAGGLATVRRQPGDSEFGPGLAQASLKLARQSLESGRPPSFK